MSEVVILTQKSNFFSAAKGYLTLTVNSVLQSVASSYTVDEGDSLSLGFESLIEYDWDSNGTWQWVFDGEVIDGETTSTLEIASAAGADVGLYKLRHTETGTGKVREFSLRIASVILDFYVDSINGNDANDGSINAPYRSLDKVREQAALIGDGVRIGLAAGSYWRDGLDFGDDTGLDLINIYIRGYGDLATHGLPVLDASDVMDGEWQDSTDRADANTNVYSQALTWEGGTATFPSVWEDDVLLRAVDDLATCQATPGSFTTANGVLQNTDGNDVVVYVHPAGSTNPSSDGKLYEYAARRYSLRIGDDSTAKYIWTKKQTHGNGSFKGGLNCTAEGMLCTQGVKHEALLESGIYRRCVSWHPDHDLRTNSIMMEFFTPDGAGQTGTYEDCVCVGPGVVQDTLITTQPCDAFTGHTSGNPGENYDSIVTRRCSAKFAAGVVGNTDCDSFTTEDIYALECASLAKNDLGTVDGLWWHATQAVQNQGRLWWFGDAVLRNAQVYLGGNSEFLGFSTNTSVTIENSVFVFDTTDDFQSIIGNTASIAFTESIVALIRSVNQNFTDNFTAGVVFTGTNNVFYDAFSGLSRFRSRLAGTVYTGVTAFLTAYPDAGTAITTNPNITDPANGNFSLSAPLANGAGLARTPTYTPIPATIEDAEDWIVSNAQ